MQARQRSHDGTRQFERWRPALVLLGVLVSALPLAMPACTDAVAPALTSPVIEAPAIAAPATVASAPVASAPAVRHTLDGAFSANGGHAFSIAMPEGTPPGDTVGAPARSPLVLFEDDRELGPAHALHEVIRTHGAGSYSHWDSALIFSASDGSDPNANGRRYAYELRAASRLPGEDAPPAALIAAELALRASTHEQRVQAALDFVHDNSEHRIDAEHDLHAFDTPRVLQWMWLRHTGQRTDLPPLSCGPRASAMHTLLDELGISSRLVQVFSSRGDEVGAHRFLEVLDPRTSRWECWDPDNAVCYVEASTRERVGVEQLILQGSQQVVPRRGDLAGWEALQLGWLGEQDFAAVLFEAIDSEVGMQDPVILFDPRRFDPDRRFADGESFRQWAQRMFGTCRFVPVASAR